MNSHNVVCYAGPTLEDNWADFGSDSSLLTVAGVFPLRGWSEQIICPNDPVLLEVYRRNLNVTDWIGVSPISNPKYQICLSLEII